MAEETVMVRTPHLLYKHCATMPWTSEKESVHAHSLYELIYFVRGDAYHVIEDRRYRLLRGDLVIVRPGRFHDIRFESMQEYERYNLLFDAEALGLSKADEVSGRFEVVSLSERPMTGAIFEKMEMYRVSMPEDEFVTAVGHLLFELLYDLSLIPAEEGRASLSVNPLLSRALGYIRDHLFTVKDVAEVARAMYVTESYLFRLFRRELKTGPKRYITEKRLLAARSLIRRGRRPSEVYLECGFGDYTGFFRSYKAFFGHSPSKE